MPFPSSWSGFEDFGTQPQTLEPQSHSWAYGGKMAGLSLGQTPSRSRPTLDRAAKMRKFHVYEVFLSAGRSIENLRSNPDLGRNLLPPYFHLLTNFLGVLLIFDH